MTNPKTIHQLAIEMSYDPTQELPESAFWVSLPAVDIDTAERLIRQVECGNSYALVVAILRGATPERMTALKARFTPAELTAIAKAQRIGA